MPIKPPNLDDRRYADIVREARALIPQYCPEWTNLGDADPGMTLVQLFAWMTEMTIFRLNRVPDKTYIHFLNFIGEERREARPARLVVTFRPNHDDGPVELPAFSRVSTRQQTGVEALRYLTTDRLTVHHCGVERVVVVEAGEAPSVREIPFITDRKDKQVLMFGSGKGLSLFEMDPSVDGVASYTPSQYLYVGHDDFAAMDFELEEGMTTGRVRLRTATDENLPIAGLFRWERFNGEDWIPVDMAEEEEEVLGIEEVALTGHMPRIAPVEEFGHEDDSFPLEHLTDGSRYWIRGTMDFERWLAFRMAEDLTITWRDDRSGDDRLISNWDVRDVGHVLEFSIRDMPPIRAGWTVQLMLVDRSMATGRSGYLPRYRWSFRRGTGWETIPDERVRMHETAVTLTGPFPDMATDGVNLRAERIETLNLTKLLPGLEVEGRWLRPVVHYAAAGPESGAAGLIESDSYPILPFQASNSMAPILGMKYYLGSDLFENRAQKPIMVEIEIGFTQQGELLPEPKEDYHLQLTYRAVDTWRVVWDEQDRYAQFTLSDLDPDGAANAARRKIRLFLDPKTQLKGLHRAPVGGRATAWLRFELTRAALTSQKDKNSPPLPVSIKVFSVKIGLDTSVTDKFYEQAMPGLRTVSVEYRAHNRRLTRALVRSGGKLHDSMPFDGFIDTAPDEAGEGHLALYMQLDKPLPEGARHAIHVTCLGETYLSDDVSVVWEVMEDQGHGQVGWRRLAARDDVGGFALNRTGVLSFPYADAVKESDHGSWLRALIRSPTDGHAPTFPPVSHVMLNSVEVVNLHAFRTEKFSGLGVPHQTIQLAHYPVFQHPGRGDRPVFPYPDRFPDITVSVVEEDGKVHSWRRAPDNSMLLAEKDGRYFVVDPVEGTLTFGNGIRGKILPVGAFNVTIEEYYTVPGSRGNVGTGMVELCEGFADLCSVRNVVPATGGRDAETIDQILRRAPSVLTSRDRAVTRQDFEIIANESSAEVARAACTGEMGGDGEVEVVILPQRRPGEVVPDTYLATGLKEHVQRYLSRRCLVNVQPRVRLAAYRSVDVSLRLRLRPNANFVHVRDQAEAWVRTFLDPYAGGLDGGGWPFGGTLFAQDFGRMVTDIGDVRHVGEVHLYDVKQEESTAGWERGDGLDTLVIDSHDLFVVRHVRIVSETA